MKASFCVCVDESGDQGFVFDGEDRSSEWFVLSAILGLRDCNTPMSDLVKKIKTAIGWQLKKPLHFKDVSARNRENVICQVASATDLMRAIVVMVYKPLLSNPEAFQEANRLYFYFTRFLLERASWLCRDSKEAKDRQHGDGSARVIFSKMGEMSCDQLVQYFTRLQAIETSIDWSIIRPDQFETLAPSRHAGLQIADVVAGAFYCTDHACAKRKTNQWASMLKPILYRSRQGRYRGYGLKIYPAGGAKQNAQDDKAPWANTIYPM